MTKELYLLLVLVAVLANALVDVACSVERRPLVPSQSAPRATADECTGLPMADRIPCFEASHSRR